MDDETAADGAAGGGEAEGSGEADRLPRAAGRGELVAAREDGGRTGPLLPMKSDLAPECRALALRLRELFSPIGVSIRVYALRTQQSPATVARYLSGARVPPAEFVDQLAVTAAKATGRPVSEEVLAHLRDLHREALRATDKVGWELQRLRDRLADADRHREQAETLAEVLTDALRERKARIAEMEVDQRRIAAAGAAEREAYGAEIARLRDTEEGLRTERDRLRAEVTRLQDQLDQARRQVMAAEWRCDELEHQLATAEEKAAGTAMYDPYAEQLDLAEEQRAVAEREAERLRAEMASLRAERDEAVRTAAEAARLEEERKAAEQARQEEERARKAADRAHREQRRKAGEWARQAATRASQVAGEQDAEQTAPDWGMGQAVRDEAERELARMRAGLAKLRAEHDQEASARADAAQRVLEELGRHQTAQAWAADLMARGGLEEATFTAEVLEEMARWRVDRETARSRTERELAAELMARLLEGAEGDTTPEELWEVIGLRPETARELLRNLAAESPQTRVAEAWRVESVREGPARAEWMASGEVVDAEIVAEPAAEPEPPADERVRVPRVAEPGYPGESAEAPAAGEPVLRNPLFVGREDLIEAVRARLEGADTEVGMCVLTGLPGVGKSELAAEYAHRYSGRYDLVRWIDPAPLGTVRERLGAIAAELERPAGGAGEEHGRRPERRWLVVLDGAEDPFLVRELLPKGPGRVLITSRNRRWAGRGADVLTVPELRRAESIAYLMRAAGSGTPGELDTLADRLGDLPLLLVRAARHMAITLTGPDHLARRVAEGHGRHPALGIEQLFGPVLNRLRDRSPGAYDMLRWCALFEDGAVPLALLDPLLAARDADGPVVSLVRKSLLNRDLDREGRPYVWMHRALRAEVRHRIPAEERARLTGRIRAALIEAEPGDPASRKSWVWYGMVTPHLEAVGALADAETEALVFGCVRVLHFRGQARAGVGLAERALAGWRRLGADHPRLNAMAGLHTTLLRADGRYQRAEALDRAELDRQHGLAGGPHHPETLNALRGLAADLRGLGRYAEAHEQAELVYQGRLSTRGPDHWVTHAARLELADSLRLLGRYREALELDEAGVEAMRGRTGDAAAQALRLLGRQGWALGLRLTGAGRALAVQAPVAEEARRLQGPDSPLALGAELELALCELRQEDRSRGLDRLRTVYGRATELFGQRAPLTLLALAHLAMAEALYGRGASGGDLAARSLEGYRAVFGGGHPYTLGAMANQAITVRMAGGYEEAERLGRLAGQGFEDVLGPDHPWTLGAFYNLGASRLARGRTREAHQLMSETHLRAVRSLGAGHPLPRLMLELGPGKTNPPWPFEPLPL
ncbi:FxSxx-COOH system tetratricopeptide repeat protein [Streptomyces palmae]|uniref:FxSxx-COOH system tetratricopeptide repeat protein n=1 Tax=Streptomyces palmae TaxID=1701085 RepID=UPI001432E911|nr:FxSxx-COOH system tetratricopeptide repeat protein [Streptomyces palmae]